MQRRSLSRFLGHAQLLRQMRSRPQLSPSFPCVERSSPVRKSLVLLLFSHNYSWLAEPHNLPDLPTLNAADVCQGAFKFEGHALHSGDLQATGMKGMPYSYARHLMHGSRKVALLFQVRQEL
jgi:hypothetical protein